MAVMTKKELRKLEEYFYYVGYKNWYPFPQDLKKQLRDIYGKKPFPQEWNEQDIFEGSKKLIREYFKNNSN